jgi:hypothetical protein
MPDEITLDGRESALVSAALFVAALWEFEKPAARALLPEDLDAVIRPVHERVSARWRARLLEAGLWTQRPAPWTPALIAERGQLSDGLRLSLEEVHAVVPALHAAAHEFAASWWELCTIAPGPLDWYGLSHDDLAALADRLARAIAA